MNTTRLLNWSYAGFMHGYYEPLKYLQSADLKLQYGAVLTVTEGAKVQAGQIIATWDPHTHPIIQDVARCCPIETATEIDGRPSDGSGILRPPVDPSARPDWPEAFWLLQNRCRRSLTLEAPSDFPLPFRVAALTTAVRTALRKFEER